MPLNQDQIKCQYGEIAGEDGCHCQIEDIVIRARTDPTSLMAFCTGEPTACPTLRKERDGQDLQGLVKEAAEFRSARAADKEDRAIRIEAAKELLTSDTPEGQRFRERIRRVMDSPATQARLKAAGARNKSSGLILPPGMG